THGGRHRRHAYRFSKSSRALRLRLTRAPDYSKTATKITEAGVSNHELGNDQFANSSFPAKRSEVEESPEGTKHNATGPSTPLCCAQDDRGSLALLFFSCVTADQLALCDHMTFHRGIQLVPLRTRPQIEFAIESENLE